MTSYRTSSLVLLCWIAACGPSPKPKSSTSSVVTDGPQPQSTEWLYATAGSSGVVKQECKLVVQALEKEAECSGDLCQYAINLGRDWLRTCRSFEPANVGKVEKLVSTFEARAKVSGGECAFKGVEFIEQGCPEAADCDLAAQDWATRCSKHTSPLVVRMIEKQIERKTQTPVTLDTTSCSELFARLTESTDCGNDFECTEKIEQFKQYQARCVNDDVPLPLDAAVKQALLLKSAKQQPPAFRVKDSKFGPEQGRLLLDDRSGFVVSVGDYPAPNVNLFIKTLRDSEFTLSVNLARVFTETANRHVLRLGSIDAPDPETFFRRFRTLELEGQGEALRSEAANSAIQALNRAVKLLDQQEQALGGLIQALAAAELVQHDQDFKGEVEKADKHLTRVFQKLAATKRAKLPRAHVQGEQMRDRVAYARRSWKQPFADLAESGRFEMGAVNRAVVIDVAQLLPLSFASYRESMDGTVGKALRPLESKHEQALVDNARSHAARCGEHAQARARHEQELVACAFGQKQCAEADREKAAEALDAAASAHGATRLATELALLELKEPPQGELKQAVAACRP